MKSLLSARDIIDFYLLLQLRRFVFHFYQLQFSDFLLFWFQNEAEKSKLSKTRKKLFSVEALSSRNVSTSVFEP